VIIGIPKEVAPRENRVAITPETTRKLVKLGFEVCVQQGAGRLADFTDSAYEEAGARIVEGAPALWAEADLVLKVLPPDVDPQTGVHEAELLKVGGHMISFIWPAMHKELLERLAARKATVLAMDCIPRISRAQKMDALSSMANIAGYRAVVEAANHFGRFFTGQMTAAGTVQPAKVLVIGAGVAGLAAIGAARNLGAIVRAFDTRPAVKDQVISMGAEFLEVDLKEDGTGTGGYAKEMSPEFIKAEMELFAQQAREVDIIITTALIPGRKAPTLITTEMVKRMRGGSVIVDLASQNGGNCELTEPDKVVTRHGVKIIGFTDLAGRLAAQASQLYGNNMLNLLSDMCKGEQGYRVNLEDVVVRGALVLHEGRITWPPPKLELPAQDASRSSTEVVIPPENAAGIKRFNPVRHGLMMGAAGLLLLLLGTSAPAAFLTHFTVFVLSCFIGYQVIWNVTPALHTPLMSVTNAISGIILVGAMLQLHPASGLAVKVLAAFALLIAMINVAGGFLVTHRMLSMFRR
jgi:NAD(P) transhydrogenase subunit alpha